MKIILISSFLFLVFFSGFSQGIKEMEYDLGVSKSGEIFGKKIKKAKYLQSIDPFNYTATEYICRYYSINKIDSISIFFNHLIKSHQNKAEPLILRSEFVHFEYPELDKKDVLIKRIDLLEQSLKIDTLNIEATYKLAKIYYNDFIRPLEKDNYFEFFYGNEVISEEIDSTIINERLQSRKSILSNNAQNALIYLENLWQLNEQFKSIVYFPIKQLECFLSKDAVIKENLMNLEYRKKEFFPDWCFMNLKDKWKCDFTVNYFFEAESSKRNGENIGKQLIGLNEKSIFSRSLNSNQTVFRFTWLRSFDNPISIRLEKVQNKIILISKIGKGAGGYEPEGLKKSKRKKLNKRHWKKFLKLVNESSFYEFPNEEYYPMTDGASWVLEFKEGDNYKVFDTNNPDKKFIKACLYLIQKSNIKVKKNEIY